MPAAAARFRVPRQLATNGTHEALSILSVPDFSFHTGLVCPQSHCFAIAGAAPFVEGGKEDGYGQRCGSPAS